ncbi:zinc metallochaperone AztD [Ornithinimicrobium sp. Y1694]|uniref:zinc metallochaperone AztD n=1 Tax=Ornithinimicrobium sp. Y1694 TaxID=3418590 RepID=UPI003CF2489C
MMSRRTAHRRPTTSLALLSLSALVLASCAQTGSSNGTSGDGDTGAAGRGTATTQGEEVQAGVEEATSDGGGQDSEAAQASEPVPDAVVREAAGPTPRLAVSYDGGVMVIDAMSLDVLTQAPLEGFVRLNPAGDGRHLFVTEGDSLRLLDAGTWSEPHGNHDHSYTTTPTLTDLTVEGEKPGHVVPHGGRTALYFDGAGRVDLIDPTTLDASAGQITIERSHEVPEAHHGVALLLEDGSLLETVGTSEERTGARVVDADGQETARIEECPGVHGEAVAADDVVVLGCQDGLVVYRDGDFSKVTSPDDYGRIGNQAGTPLSPVVLGDYKVDPDADLERPERVSLTDTRTGELQLVDLGTSYTFRSLARGPQGEALVLGTDGSLHVLDPDSGQTTHTVPVIAEWQEPAEWQQPRPTLFVLGQFGYVTEPATRELHILDLDTMAVIDSVQLPEVPHELTGVDGRVADSGHGAGSGHEGHEGHEDHDDHDDHDHEDHEGHDH